MASTLPSPDVPPHWHINLNLAYMFQLFFVYEQLSGNWLINSFGVSLIANCLCYASSSCNPIIYTIFSERFRTRFRQILFCQRSENHYPSNKASTLSHVSPQNRTKLICGPRLSKSLVDVSPRSGNNPFLRDETFCEEKPNSFRERSDTYELIPKQY